MQKGTGDPTDAKAKELAVLSKEVKALERDLPRAGKILPGEARRVGHHLLREINEDFNAGYVLKTYHRLLCLHIGKIFHISPGDHAGKGGAEKGVIKGVLCLF